MAIDEDDEIDLDVGTSGGRRRSSSDDDSNLILVLLALAGGLIGGYLLWCFLNQHNGGYGYRRQMAMPWDGLSRMPPHPFSETRNSINIYETIPKRRPTPLSPGYPSYYENWKVYRDAFGQMVDIRPGDLIGR